MHEKIPIRFAIVKSAMRKGISVCIRGHNMKNMSVSVVLASYNGARYIHEQVESILSNISSDDELIVTDDGSTDSTVEYVEEYKRKHKNIKLIQGPRRGVVANFENGIKHSAGDLIFLSDQDDVWLPGKVDRVKSLFSKDLELTCVLHDVTVVDGNLNVINNSFFELRGSRPGFWNNILKNSYMGSAMAFKRSVLPYVLPIPSNVPMHDQWIGLVNDCYGKVMFDHQQLGLYRRHDSNVSNLEHGKVSSMIRNRVHLLTDLYYLSHSGK